jgi:hypothetical protein
MLFATLILACSNSILPGQLLEKAKSIHDDLSDGQSREYTFRLAAGQYARISVMQDSIDVAVTCLGHASQANLDDDVTRGEAMTRRQLISMAAASAFAAERLDRAPISHEPLKLTLSQAEPVKLSNGIAVLTIEDKRLPIATALCQVEGAGAIHSPKPGVAELTADMLVEGAGKRSGRQIADEAARLGAQLTSMAPAGAETITVEGSGLTGHMAEWMELFSSLVLHPTFPADEFSGLKQRRLVDARLRLTRPATIAYDTGQRLLFRGHPAGMPAPAPEALAALTPEMLAAWDRERYTPGEDGDLVRGKGEAFDVGFVGREAVRRMEGARHQCDAAARARATKHAAHRAGGPARGGADRTGDR